MAKEGSKIYQEYKIINVSPHVSMYFETDQGQNMKGLHTNICPRSPFENPCLGKWAV